MKTVHAQWFHVFLICLSSFSNDYIYFCQVTTSIFNSSSFFFSRSWRTNPPMVISCWNPLTIVSNSVSKPISVCMSVCRLSGCWSCSQDQTHPSLLQPLQLHLQAALTWAPDASTHAGGLVHVVRVDEDEVRLRVLPFKALRNNPKSWFS